MNLALIEKVRKVNPLVHNITNLVVANDSANGLLALGASPFMSNTVAEVEEIQTFNAALVLNMGTINDEQLSAMLLAGKAANSNGKPVVIDPVGAGATAYRKKVSQQLLAEIQPTLIRGNAGELASIANIPWEAKGVDAGVGSADLSLIAETVARQYNCLVLISGETDIITNGHKTYLNHNGTSYFTSMTGSGCLLSCVCGAYLGVVNHHDSDEALAALIVAATTYSLAGQLGVKTFSQGAVGSFRRNLLDQLTVIDQDIVQNFASGEWRNADA